MAYVHGGLCLHLLIIAADFQQSTIQLQMCMIIAIIAS